MKIQWPPFLFHHRQFEDIPQKRRMQRIVLILSNFCILNIKIIPYNRAFQIFSPAYHFMTIFPVPLGLYNHMETFQVCPCMHAHMHKNSKTKIKKFAHKQL
jgi:hypothetical protein